MAVTTREVLLASSEHRGQGGYKASCSAEDSPLPATTAATNTWPQVSIVLRAEKPCFKTKPLKKIFLIELVLNPMERSGFQKGRYSRQNTY